MNLSFFGRDLIVAFQFFIMTKMMRKNNGNFEFEIFASPKLKKRKEGKNLKLLYFEN